MHFPFTKQQKDHIDINSLFTKDLLQMTTIGPYEEVLRTFYRKAEGEKLHGRKTALILQSGMQRGAIQAAQCDVFEKLGFLPDGVDVVVGSSVGATIGRELIAHNMHQLRNFFYHDSVTKGVILKRLIPPYVDFIAGEDILRKHGADENHVKKAKTDLYIGLRKRATAECGFVNAKEIDDTMAAVIASMTIPFITKSYNLPINGEHCCDASHANILPIRFAIEELGATDILVLFTDNPFVTEKLLNFVTFLFSSMDNLSHHNPLGAITQSVKETHEHRKFFKKYNAQPHTVRLAGFYPATIPLAPNDTRVPMIQKCMDEAEKFATTIGTFVKDSLEMPKN